MSDCLREVRMERRPNDEDRLAIFRKAREERDRNGSTVCLRWPKGAARQETVDATTDEILAFKAKTNEITGVYLCRGHACVAAERIVAVGVARGLWVSLRLQDVRNVGPATEVALRNAGIDSVRALADSSEEDVHDILSDSGIRSSAATIINNANDAMNG